MESLMEKIARPLLMIAAFLHGNSEWVSSIEVQKYSALYIAAMLLWSTLLCLTLGNLL